MARACEFGCGRESACSGADDNDPTTITDQVEGLGRVATATSIPVATGERLTTRAEFHDVLQAGVVSGPPARWNSRASAVSAIH